MELTLAKKEQIEIMTEISKAAFDTDIEVGAGKAGGPPDYDSVEWHRKMQESGNLYVLLHNDSVIGGAILFSDMQNEKVLYVGRICVSPQYHRQGYGIEMMRQIEEKFQEAQSIRLDTPIWNVRTNAFYQKCGYRETHRDNKFVYYEKKLFPN